jgi:hypothetical protein
MLHPNKIDLTVVYYRGESSPTKKRSARVAIAIERSAFLKPMCDCSTMPQEFSECVRTRFESVDRWKFVSGMCSYGWRSVLGGKSILFWAELGKIQRANEVSCEEEPCLQKGYASIFIEADQG